MELFLMSLITGILVGGIYALVALGWVLIYKCSGVLNLAMGELTLIGAYVTLTFYQAGIPFIPAVACTLLVGIVLGFLTERIFLDKLIGEPILAVIMVTVGLSFFFKGIVAFIWSTDTKVFDPPIFAIKPIEFGFLKLSPVYLWSFILAIVLLHHFCQLFQSTPAGDCPCRPPPMMNRGAFPGSERPLCLCRRMGHSRS
jgi:branched-chain amino acid transport system permease protein